MPEYMSDHCYDISLIATKDDNFFDGCEVANESDEFNMCIADVMQRLITEEEIHRMILKEENVNELIEDPHVEEEEIPP